MNDWNPDLYLKFGSERTRPAVDLIARLNAVNPTSIIDVGCGPGNSTRVLAGRWPNAQITGLDSSAAMIEKAKQSYPDQEWIVGDAAGFEPGAAFDLVFSNAVIQWIPDHDALLRRFHGMLSNNGVLAVQVPLFWDMPLGKIIHEISTQGPWKEQTAGVSDLFTIQDYPFYYDILSGLFNAIDMWVSDYMHVLDSHVSILEMMQSTGLRPYLDRLDTDLEKQLFETAVLKKVETAYPKQKNGRVILPFKRLFFIGYR